MTLLDVRDLSVRFDSEDGVVGAVDGVSFSLDAGQVLGIVGESGSGKSVTSMTLLGLTRIDGAHVSGVAEFDGRDLVAMPEEELRAVRGGPIAMIFQDPLSSLHPFYRIGAQLVEAYRVHHDVSKKVARERAIEMLGLVGIPEPKVRVDAYPHEFSGGMRQRVMIAMALINDPRLLIADEPTTALDVTVQAQILDLLEKLRSELGTAIVMITHDLGVVAQMADEIAVMYAGRIVEHGTAKTVFAAPQHPYTWGLLRSIPRLDVPRDAPLVPISGRPPSLIHPPTGCRFHPRCPYALPSHARIDPALEPVAGEEHHEVACLLPAETRRALWRELRAGAEPEEARARVPFPEEAEATGA
jgi:peptide/nickel transport system ATP-binding protein